MFRLGRITSTFASIKPLQTTAVSLPAKGLKVTHLSTGKEVQIESPLQTYISALAACEYESLKALLKTNSKINLKNVKFDRIESSYDLKHWHGGGGKGNQIGDIFIEAEVQININQSELDALMKQVENLCPIYQMITASGVKVHSTWKIKKHDSP